jgi:16S rRNA (uracil1498-N3)-methyltransferase
MQQYFVNQKLTTDMEFEMTQEQSRHISTVLRMTDGKIIRLADTSGFLYYGSIQISKTGVRVKVTQPIDERRESKVKIALAVALIKGDRWDWMLEKATECGVTKIVPFISSRCVVKDKPETAQRKLERYRKILTEAAEQSYRHIVPEITEPVSYKQLIDHKSMLNFVAYEKEDSCYLYDIHDEISSVTIVIGPEGGFSVDEIDYLTNRGFTSVSLGKRIFRAETAAIAACIMLDTLGEQHD